MNISATAVCVAIVTATLLGVIFALIEIVIEIRELKAELDKRAR